VSRPNIDIPTQFRPKPGLDMTLIRDLGRLGSAVEKVYRDPSVRRWPETIPVNGDATLAFDAVTRLTPPSSGTVHMQLPAGASANENHEAELVVTATTGATVQVNSPAGTTIDGAASISFGAAPAWLRYKFHGGNWYSG